MFELSLSGSARRWYYQLPEGIKMDIQGVYSAFLTMYKPLGLNQVSYKSLAQLPYEPVQQYSERVTEKGENRQS